MAIFQQRHDSEEARLNSKRILVDGEIFITNYIDDEGNVQRVIFVGDGNTMLKDLTPQTVTPKMLEKAVSPMTELTNGTGHPDNKTIEVGLNGELSTNVIRVVDNLPNNEDADSDVLYLLTDDDGNCSPYTMIDDELKPFKINVTIPTMTSNRLGIGKPDGITTEVDDNGNFSAKIFKVVDLLPTAETANEDVIYLIQNENNRYEQYYLIDGSLVRINESLTANKVFLVVNSLPDVSNALLDVIYFVKDGNGNCTTYTFDGTDYVALTNSQVYGIMTFSENGVGRPDGKTIEVDTDGIFTAKVLRVVDTLPENIDAVEGIGYLKSDNNGNYSMYALIDNEVKLVCGSGGSGSGGISFVLDTDSEEIVLEFNENQNGGDDILSVVVKTIQTSKLRDGGRKLIIDANSVDQDSLTHADEVAGNVINGRFKARRGNEQTFITRNPIFLDGELVIIKDKGQYVVGDGVTAFVDLTRYSLAGTDYSAGDGIIIAADNKISVDTPIFTGIHSVWDVFTDDEKAVYKIVNFTDGNRGTYSYNSTTQELTIIAGRSEIQYGATASRKGDITGNISANSSIRVIVTFDESMPDENYILAVEPDMIAVSWAIINKDADGFVLVVTNTNESDLSVKFDWNAFKLFEVAVISDLQDDIDSKANASDVYTKAEIDQKLQEIRDLIS